MHWMRVSVSVFKLFIFVMLLGNLSRRGCLCRASKPAYTYKSKARELSTRVPVIIGIALETACYTWNTSSDLKSGQDRIAADVPAAYRLAAAKHVLKTHPLPPTSFSHTRWSKPPLPVKLEDQEFSNQEPQAKLSCPIFRGLSHRSCTSLAEEALGI